MRKRRQGLSWVLAVFLLAVPAAAPAAPERAEAGVYTVPSRMCGPFFLVPLRLPDKAGHNNRELTFLFDSGASVSAVDPDAVARISERKVKTGDRMDLVDARAGPLTFKRLAAGVRELDHLARALG